MFCRLLGIFSSQLIIPWAFWAWSPSLWSRPAGEAPPQRRDVHRKVRCLFCFVFFVSRCFWFCFLFVWFFAVGVPSFNTAKHPEISEAVLSWHTWGGMGRNVSLYHITFLGLDLYYREESSCCFLWENHLLVQLQYAAQIAGNKLLMNCINSPRCFIFERAHSEWQHEAFKGL